MSKVMHDKDGQKYLVDDNGNVLYDECGNRIPPQQSQPISNKYDGFTSYDTTGGHCGLCGRLSCNGRCFK